MPKHVKSVSLLPLRFKWHKQKKKCSQHRMLHASLYTALVWLLHTFMWLTHRCGLFTPFCEGMLLHATVWLCVWNHTPTWRWDYKRRDLPTKKERGHYTFVKKLCQPFHVKSIYPILLYSQTCTKYMYDNGPPAYQDLPRILQWRTAVEHLGCYAESSCQHFNMGSAQQGKTPLPTFRRNMTLNLKMVGCPWPFWPQWP